MLLQYLYSFLPTPVALDIGANVGDVTARLLDSGYEVYAFEPKPTVFERLKERFALRDSVHSFRLAIGSSAGTMDLHVAVASEGRSSMASLAL